MKKRYLIALLLFFAVSSVLTILILIIKFSLKTNSVSTKVDQIEPTPKIEVFKPVQKYFLHRDITATVFWVGEEASAENNYISNKASIWDANWEANFGGVDSPTERNGWLPAGFIPKQNPFYVALPYLDFEGKTRKENAKQIPWYKENIPENVSLIKNRWLKISRDERECFAQWEDAGPFLTDDVDYVFGKNPPSNNFGQRAGIDISPAVRDCLEVGSVSKVDWQFAEDEEVPEGPWKLIITENGTNW